MAPKFTKRLLRGRRRETCAITVDQPKAAALCFDKVYTSNSLDVPMHLRPVYARFGNAAVVGGTAARKFDFRPNSASLHQDLQRGAVELCRGLTQEGLRPVRYYDELEFADAAYQEGDSAFIGIALRNIDVASEEALDWGSVLQFREDPEAIADYRRMRHWFDAKLVSKPLTFVEDEISIRMEKYLDALSKHGVSVRRGEIMSCVAKAGAAAAGVAALSIVGLPGVIAAVATALSAMCAGGTVVAKVREIKADERTQRVSGQGAEVAFVHRIYELQDPTNSRP